MRDLISVIVPVYNVEKYLNNCVVSILSQTYGNIEIILIDDGSQDNCAKMLDAFEKMDKRIAVIHKENGGLSDARNVGLDIAKGKYLMFVDSDDYIPDDCIEYLHNSILMTGADISIGRLKVTALTNDSEINSESTHFLYDRNEGINQLLYANKYSVAAPGKLYLASLFDGIIFPIGKLHEDLFTTYKVFMRADKIYYGDKLVYYYYHRPGSIMHSKFSIKRLHIIDALNQIESDIPLEEYGCKKGFASQNVEDMYMLLALEPGENIIKQCGIWNRVVKYRLTVLFDHNSSKRVRGYALLSFLGCKLSTIIYRKYQSIKWG